MSDQELNRETNDVEQRVKELSQVVEIDCRHRFRLHEELLQRHQELAAQRVQRNGGILWSRLPGLGRVTLVGGPALAAALALSLVIWTLQISGHPGSQNAQAADITQALTRTVPTVTGWTVTVRRERGQTISTMRIPYRLTRYQRIYILNGRTYFYSDGHWYSLPPGWAWTFDIFAVLPSHLAHHQFTVLPKGRVLFGRRTEGITFTMMDKHGRQTETTAWVDRGSGLVLQLNWLVRKGGKLLERDSATYRYQTSR